MFKYVLNHFKTRISNNKGFWGALAGAAIPALSSMFGGGDSGGGGVGYYDPRSDAQRASDDAIANAKVGNIDFLEGKRDNAWGDLPPQLQAYFDMMQMQQKKNLRQSTYGDAYGGGTMGDIMAAGAMGGVGPKGMMAQMGKAGQAYNDQATAIDQYIQGLNTNYRQGWEKDAPGMITNQTGAGGSGMQGGMYGIPEDNSTDWGSILGGAAGGFINGGGLGALKGLFGNQAGTQAAPWTSGQGLTTGQAKYSSGSPTFMNQGKQFNLSNPYAPGF